MDHIAVAKIFKAFCDENRLKIIEILQEGEKCGCVLLESLDISQSTLSHHIKILVESKIINTRKQGKWSYYSVCREGIKSAKEILENIEMFIIEPELNEELNEDCS
ncbi:transcriptional regulator [Candidatus Epulonipiscium fishelsonii]|uniref:Transcriptional regulator n=1 Tax=Candidatus Epulonipiscium fishelsonii TaxID=77094 RepID=A0ACC8XHF9_9FIRM|nr:transcriptional regulator [Epulopiscium sp. SCG-D08WGA-EpuloA1]OON93310.1 MAG: transcriptional regulator [Epulopiscium sp. AS2M-Bin002]